MLSHAFVLGFWQEEYEELLRYAVVNPNVGSSASQPSHLRGEAVPDRFPVLAGMYASPARLRAVVKIPTPCDPESVADADVTVEMSPPPAGSS